MTAAAWVCLIPIFLPAAVAVSLPASAKSKADLHQLTVFALGLDLFCALFAALCSQGNAVLFSFSDFSFTLQADTVGRYFSVIFALVFCLAGLFGFEYFAHDEREKSYTAFYLLTLASLQGLCWAGNLFTFYLFYEAMSLCSLPMVLHEGTMAARRAGMQYFGYSLFGACMALFGFLFAQRACFTTTFTPGGSLQGTTTPMVLAAAFCMALGFGGKAGLLPLHAWLPIAHPEAPAPASAVLSGAITKAGILGVIRVVYYVFGADALRDTWVQAVLVTLALCTVFAGSMLALKEKLLKRRLAWSTVSQASYVLFGLFLLCPEGFTGSLLQAGFHALAKTCLFLCAGAIIHGTGYTRVAQLRGIGRQMPVVMWCFALASLSLIGIPPLAGFVSKWYLAQGSLLTLGSLGWLGCAVLLVSALLTAGYLMPIVGVGFFPGNNWPTLPKVINTPLSQGALCLFAGLLVVLGIFPLPLISWFAQTAAAVL